MLYTRRSKQKQEKKMETMIFLTFVVISLSLYFTSLWYKLRKNVGVFPLPPGQTGLPFIGETLDLHASNKRGQPQNFVNSRTHKFSSKIFRTSLFGENMVVFCGAAANKFLLTMGSELVRPGFPKIMRKILSSTATNGNEKLLTIARKFTNAFFKPEFLHKKSVAIMDGVFKEKFDEYCTSDEQRAVLVAVTRDLAKKYTLSIACRIFLNVYDRITEEKIVNLQTNIAKGFVCLPLDLPGTQFHSAVKSSCGLRKEIESIVKQKRLQVTTMSEKTSDLEINSSTDMLSHILLSSFNEHGEFPIDVLVADMFYPLFIAGIDSVTSTITLMVKHLVDHPHVYAQVLQEQTEIAKNKKAGELLDWNDVQNMKYTWCVAQETMRLTPPVPGALRDVVADFTYAGFTIPKNWKVYWTVQSTNKNPEYFKNPEEFDPTRFYGSGPAPYTFVPFGGGIHICPGKEYARIQMLVFIHNLVTRYHIEKVLPEEKITYVVGATLLNGYPIRLHARNTTQ